MEMGLRLELINTGAVLEGEYFFALKKQGNISCKYINMDPVFTRPRVITLIGEQLAAPWKDSADTLAAPAVGGIPLLYAAAEAFHFYPEVAWADKQRDGTFAFERMGFTKAIQGKKVVLLEDIVSTGGSAYAVAELVRQAGGEVIGASFVWNRGNVTAQELGVPILHSLIEESVEVFKAGEHPQWGAWPLVMDIGHSEYFPDYPGPKIKLL
jgi:orotate phosphoribosyltransferase